MKHIVKFLDYFEIGWSVLLMTAIITIMTTQIFCRFVLGSPLSWPEELAVLLACYLSFVGVSIVHRRKGHMVFTTVVERWPTRSQKVIDVIIHLSTIALFAVILATSISLQKVQVNFLYFAALPIKKNLFTMPITICAFSMIINSINFLIEDISSEVTK
jgi:TRAP-type C4-dicarboxylate transport system permease small subunit